MSILDPPQSAPDLLYWVLRRRHIPDPGFHWEDVITAGGPPPPPLHPLPRASQSVWSVGSCLGSPLSDSTFTDRRSMNSAPRTTRVWCTSSLSTGNSRSCSYYHCPECLKENIWLILQDFPKVTVHCYISTYINFRCLKTLDSRWFHLALPCPI